MAERQLASTLSGIRADHVARYRWAAGKARGRVLDAACGCGYGAGVLDGLYVGLDRSQEAVDYARANWCRRGAHFMLGDALSPPIGFDTVVSFETLEHLDDAEAALTAFAKSAPHLLASVPNEEGLPFHPAKFPFHVRHYRLDEVEAMLARTGWSLTGFYGQKGRTSGVGPYTRDCRTIVFEAYREQMDAHTGPR